MRHRPGRPMGWSAFAMPCYSRVHACESASPIFIVCQLASWTTRGDLCVPMLWKYAQLGDLVHTHEK